MAISNYSGILCLLFEYSNNIRSQESDRISNHTVPAISFVADIFPFFSLKSCSKLSSKIEFWILLVLRISKHPQKVEFDEDLAELLKVKHNTSHMKNFQLFSQQLSS